MHGLPLTEIALVVLCALGLGFVFYRLKQPILLGYVFAGAILGPSLLSSEGHTLIVQALAELGVFMLLFLLGLELNVKSFRSVWAVSLGCVLLQYLGSFMGMLIGVYLFDWSYAMAFVLACIVTLSSTAVVIKMLQGTDELESSIGRLTVGILIAQDLAFIPMVLGIQSMGGNDANYTALIIRIIVALGVIGALIFLLGKEQKMRIPFLKDAAQSSELFPLVVLAFCFGTASITGFLGLSASYGAFLAGIVLGNTAERSLAIKVVGPIQSTLLMVFFLSIGLLLDITFIWHNIGKVLFLLMLVMASKTLLNIGLLKLLQQPLQLAFMSSLFLAQIGEFSFVLADQAMDVGILTGEDGRLVIALTVLSLIVSPFWLSKVRRIQALDKDSLDSVSGAFSKVYTREKFSYQNSDMLRSFKELLKSWRKK